MNSGKSTLLSEIQTALDQIRTRQDLIDFVDLLTEGVEKKIFDEQAVINYIEGIALVLDGLGKAAPERPDWQLFGRVLLSAFYR